MAGVGQGLVSKRAIGDGLLAIGKGAVVLLAFQLLISLFPPLPAHARAPPAGEWDISNFLIYYGQDRASDIARFDLAILSPLMDEAILSDIRGAGTLIVGYLSLTTVGDWEPWASDVEDGWVVGEWEEWGELIINACEPGWRELLLEEAIPFLMERGFQGLFLDNIDMAEEFPWMADALVELVADIRERWPSLFLVQNRGFCVADRTAPLINAFLFEDFGTFYNFTSGRYEKLSAEELSWLRERASELVELRAEYGLVVLALAYADPSDPEMMEEYMSYVNSLATEYGFISYVADIDLTYINLAYARPGEAEAPALLDKDLLLLILATVIVISVVSSVAWPFLKRRR